MKKFKFEFVVLLALVLNGPTYANRGKSVPADNTAKNTRDQNSHTLLPTDQSNSEADLAVAVKIRNDLFNGQLSTNAKNIKIVVLRDVVTLRGPVNSQLERETVAALATQAAPGMRIQNNLEIVRQ